MISTWQHAASLSAVVQQIGTTVRPILLFAAFFLTSCDVESDPANEQVTVTYDKERIKQSAADAGRTVKQVATGAANVAESTGEAIENEVGDVDVDVDVTRNTAEQQPTE